MLVLTRRVDESVMIVTQKEVLELIIKSFDKETKEAKVEVVNGPIVVPLTLGKWHEVNIEENTVLKLLAFSGNQIRIGFTAPKEINIVRKEIYKP